MALPLVFVLLTVGLTALLLGFTVVAQGYLYQEPPARAPVRALVGGLILGGFLTLWAGVDKKWPNKDGTVQYDTFFNFAPYTTAEFTEFEAVRWPVGGDGKFKTDAGGKPAEAVVKFKRSVGGKGASFVQEGTNETFILSGTDRDVRYMTGAIRVKAKDDPEPVRYNALVATKEDARTKEQTKTYTPERRFVEEKGSRYVEAGQLGTLFVPSTGTIALSLLLNVMLFVTWLVVTWPVLRYSLGHALGLTAVGTLVTMLALMPLLFKFNRPDVKPAPAVARVAPPCCGAGVPPALLS